MNHRAHVLTTEAWRRIHDAHRTPGFDHARQDAGHPSERWVTLCCTCGAAHTTTYVEADIVHASTEDR